MHTLMQYHTLGWEATNMILEDSNLLIKEVKVSPSQLNKWNVMFLFYVIILKSIHSYQVKIYDLRLKETKFFHISRSSQNLFLHF